jgi:hypothetical protein
MKLAYLRMRASEFPFAIVDCQWKSSHSQIGNCNWRLEIGNPSYLMIPPLPTATCLPGKSPVRLPAELLV